MEAAAGRLSVLADREIDLSKWLSPRAMGGFPDLPERPRKSGFRGRRWNRRSGRLAIDKYGQKGLALAYVQVFDRNGLRP